MHTMMHEGRVMARRLSLILALTCVASFAASARPPDFPAPDDADVSQVARSMTINGRTMSVRAFVADDTVEEVVEFYKELWQDASGYWCPRRRR